MLGFYPNFPENVHRTRVFISSVSAKRLQLALVETLAKLNRETFSLEEVAAPSIPSCRAVFEFGVADGVDFDFLDFEEKERLREALSKKPFRVMDFVCVVRYKNVQEQKKTRMKSDYYMLRVEFHIKTVRIRVFHEKGLRYTAPDDVVRFVVDKLNGGLSRRMLRPYDRYKKVSPRNLPPQR